MYGAHHLHFITNSCYHRLLLLHATGARDRFLAILEQTRQKYRFVVVGYLVMPCAPFLSRFLREKWGL